MDLSRVETAGRSPQKFVPKKFGDFGLNPVYDVNILANLANPTHKAFEE